MLSTQLFHEIKPNSNGRKIGSDKVEDTRVKLAQALSSQSSRSFSVVARMRKGSTAQDPVETWKGQVTRVTNNTFEVDFDKAPSDPHKVLPHQDGLNPAFELLEMTVHEVIVGGQAGGGDIVKDFLLTCQPRQSYNITFEVKDVPATQRFVVEKKSSDNTVTLKSANGVELIFPPSDASIKVCKISRSTESDPWLMEHARLTALGVDPENPSDYIRWMGSRENATLLQKIVLDYFPIKVVSPEKANFVYEMERAHENLKTVLTLMTSVDQIRDNPLQLNVLTSVVHQMAACKMGMEGLSVGLYEKHRKDGKSVKECISLVRRGKN